MAKFGKLLLIASLACFGATACKKKKDKEKGDSVKAKLAFENGTSLALNADDCPQDHDPVTCWSPTSWGIKLLNVIISDQEEGATGAAAGLIWNNPACKTTTGTHSEDDKEWEYDYMVDGCSDDDVDDYFELARDSEDVNDDLNSQEYKILPGTYNYVQMTFCIGGAKGKNAIFQTEDMDEPYEVKQGMCGLSSAKSDKPIKVEEGDSVTIALTYDLTNIIYDFGSDDPDDNCWVSEDETQVRCFGYPNSLEPSIVND